MGAEVPHRARENRLLRKKTEARSLADQEVGKRCGVQPGGLLRRWSRGPGEEGFVGLWAGNQGFSLSDLQASWRLLWLPRGASSDSLV